MIPANSDFNDASWSSGPGGIGYADGDVGTTISKVLSVYLRTSFTLLDTANISWAILHVDYDDAFVAYLNGHEIALANIGVPGVRPEFSTQAITDHEANIPSGGIPNRFIINKYAFRQYMIQGTNVLAMQVHNNTIGSSDLSSTTFLSVGIKHAGLTYRQLPVWFDDPMAEKTNLPLLIIDTRGQTIVNEPKITACLKVIDNGPGKLNGFLMQPTMKVVSELRCEGNHHKCSPNRVTA